MHPGDISEIRSWIRNVLSLWPFGVITDWDDLDKKMTDKRVNAEQLLNIFPAFTFKRSCMVLSDTN